MTDLLKVTYEQTTLKDIHKIEMNDVLRTIIDNMRENIGMLQMTKDHLTHRLRLMKMERYRLSNKIYRKCLCCDFETLTSVLHKNKSSFYCDHGKLCKVDMYHCSNCTKDFMMHYKDVLPNNFKCDCE